MSAIRLKMAYESPVMDIPCPFIDHYMNVCPPVFALIYIYSLRRVGEGETITMKKTATHFGILESDVHNAWRYWENKGIVIIDGDASDMAVTFLPPEQWGKTVKLEITKPPKIMLTTERPRYDIEELTLYKEKSKEVEKLFKNAENTLGKPLAYHDMNVLFGLYDWLRLPVDVLVFLLTYCADNNHRDLRYIEKCALDWADNDIKTVDKAEERVQNFNGEFRVILRTMGQNTGYPTPTQRKTINKWCKEWNIPMALIMEACDIAAMNIGKPNFKYVDKIITRWYETGVTTLEQVETEKELFDKTKEITKAPSRVVKPRASRFANFTQRKSDYTQFEQLQKDYILKELQG
jgi:DnaD/phage-associated family protein